MPDRSAGQAVEESDALIHELGSAFMLHPDTSARAVEHGHQNPFAFYFAGRGGVLGDVDADVVSAAMGWFQPDLVRKMWNEGVAVAGAREAARRYGQACAQWGRDHLVAAPDVDRLAVLAERLVQSAEGSGLPLFAGWRAEPLVEDASGRAQQLIHVLREWRGALHLVATTAAGLLPLQAILSNEGAGQAHFFGWQGDFPDCTELQTLHAQAEATTNSLSTTVYERALKPAERAEFTELLRGAKSAAVS